MGHLGLNNKIKNYVMNEGSNYTPPMTNKELSRWMDALQRGYNIAMDKVDVVN